MTPGLVHCTFCGAWGRLPEFEPLHLEDCLVLSEHRFRDCGACGVRFDKTEPDPCLGRLPGIQFACCGHGEGNGYLVFNNGTVVRYSGYIRIEGERGIVEIDEAELPAWKWEEFRFLFEDGEAVL